MDKGNVWGVKVCCMYVHRSLSSEPGLPPYAFALSASLLLSRYLRRARKGSSVDETPVTERPPQQGVVTDARACHRLIDIALEETIDVQRPLNLWHAWHAWHAHASVLRIMARHGEAIVTNDAESYTPY